MNLRTLKNSGLLLLTFHKTKYFSPLAPLARIFFKLECFIVFVGWFFRHQINQAVDNKIGLYQNKENLNFVFVMFANNHLKNKTSLTINVIVVFVIACSAFLAVFDGFVHLSFAFHIFCTL